MRADDKIDPKPDRPADQCPPTLLLTAQPVNRPASDNSQALTLVAGTAVVMPDSDPEQVAFNLWNAGRVDEAIEFLEREIAAERSRAKAPSRRKLSRARRKILGDAQETMASAADLQMSERRRERLRAMASDFSATGAPVGQRARDLLAVPADQIVPLPPPRHLWPLAVGLCLVIVVGIGAAMYLYAPEGRRTALVTPAAPNLDEPAETASISTAPAAANDAGSDADVIVDVAPPEEKATDEASLPVEEVFDEAPAGEETPPAAAADAAPPEEAIPTDESAAPPEEEVAALTDAEAPVEDLGVTTTASDVEVRLPRQRPEPPPEAVRAAAAAPSTIRAPELQPEEEPTVPLVLGAPPATLQPPFEQAPIHARPAGIDPYYGPPRRTTLSPEEYEALLERRALAEEYAAERRAEAEDRREYRIIGRVLPRWRRLGF